MVYTGVVRCGLVSCVYSVACVVFVVCLCVGGCVYALLLVSFIYVCMYVCTYGWFVYGVCMREYVSVCVQQRLVKRRGNKNHTFFSFLLFSLNPMVKYVLILWLNMS